MLNATDWTKRNIQEELDKLYGKWDYLRIKSFQDGMQLRIDADYKKKYEAELAVAEDAFAAAAAAYEEAGNDPSSNETTADEDGDSWLWLWLRMVARPESDEYLQHAAAELEKVEKKINKIVSRRVALIRRLEGLEMEELRIPAALR